MVVALLVFCFVLISCGGVCVCVCFAANKPFAHQQPLIPLQQTINWSLPQP